MSWNKPNVQSLLNKIEILSSSRLFLNIYLHKKFFVRYRRIVRSVAIIRGEFPTFNERTIFPSLILASSLKHCVISSIKVSVFIKRIIFNHAYHASRRHKYVPQIIRFHCSLANEVFISNRAVHGRAMGESRLSYPF